MKPLLVLLAFVVGAMPAFAQPKDPTGDKALHAYVLTMPKVKAFDAAIQALTTALEKDPALADEKEKSSEEPNETVADVRAQLEHHPKLYAFFEKQGLSKDEAILIPRSLINAVMVTKIPQTRERLNDAVSEQQIAFFKDHQVELKKMKFMGGGRGDQ